MNPIDFEAVKMSDLDVVSSPYIIIGIVILVMFVLIALVRMPRNADSNHSIEFIATIKRIFALPRYREGVVAQFFYVGAQIAVWSFTIRYVMQQLQLNDVIASLGSNPTSAQIIEKLRNLGDPSDKLGTFAVKLQALKLPDKQYSFLLNSIHQESESIAYQRYKHEMEAPREIRKKLRELGLLYSFRVYEVKALHRQSPYYHSLKTINEVFHWSLHMNLEGQHCYSLWNCRSGRGGSPLGNQEKGDGKKQQYANTMTAYLSNH